MQMAKDNKEVVFQIISALLLVISLVLGDKFFIFGSVIPIFISIIFWYNDTVKSPIRDLGDKVKSLQKDLNTRK